MFVLVSIQNSLASTITVDTLVDELSTNNGNCTLREAITAANTDSAVDACNAGATGSDTIKFTVIGSIPLVDRLPVITDSLEIIGPGMTKLFIYGWNSALTSGALFNGMLFVNSPTSTITVKIQDLTFAEGLNTNAQSHPNGTGGCISVRGQVDFTLDHVRVIGCTSDNQGGGIYFGGDTTIPDFNVRYSTIESNQSGTNNGNLFSIGGGLYIESANTVIEYSSIITNLAGTPSGLIVTGGGLAVSNGSLMIKSSTISGNFATGQYGGGLRLDTSGGGTLDVDIFNSTIHNNHVYLEHPPQPALSQGAGIALRGAGSSISFHLENTIVANNMDDLHNDVDDIYGKDNTGPTVTTGGTNWISDQPAFSPLVQPFAFPAGNPNTDGDYIHQGNPRLLPLADNGGPTKTELPDATSGVINKGACIGISTDQRGFGNLATGNRPIPNSNGCDIGAVEVGAVNISPCTITYSLPSNQWRQISLPCKPGIHNTVLDILGDEGLGTYGTDWIIYGYNPASNSYVNVGLNGILTQGAGYWVISLTNGAKTLEMPSDSTPPPTSTGDCFGGGGSQCFSLPLATQNAAVQWNMIGYPFGWFNQLEQTLVKTNAGICVSGCFLVDAQALGLVHNQLWSYNGTSGYTSIEAPDNLTPWTGYWGATLEQADGTNPTLRIPKP